MTIYAIRAASGTGFVKIGVTNGSAKGRLRELQIGSPIPILVLAEWEGEYEVETYLHKRFRGIRKHGEWFDFECDNAEVIELISKQLGMPRIESDPETPRSCVISAVRPHLSMTEESMFEYINKHGGDISVLRKLVNLG